MQGHELKRVTQIFGGAFLISFLLYLVATGQNAKMEICLEAYALNTTDTAPGCPSLSRAESEQFAFSRMSKITGPIVLGMGVLALMGLVLLRRRSTRSSTPLLDHNNYDSESVGDYSAS